MDFPIMGDRILKSINNTLSQHLHEKMLLKLLFLPSIFPKLLMVIFANKDIDEQSLLITLL